MADLPIPSGIGPSRCSEAPSRQPAAGWRTDGSSRPVLCPDRCSRDAAPIARSGVGRHPQSSRPRPRLARIEWVRSGSLLGVLEVGGS